MAVGLNSGYFTAPVVESLERRNILGVFGYRRPSRTKDTFKKKHFICSKGQDNCTKSENMKKVITRHIYTDAVDRANQMRLSPYGKKTDRRRSETIERSFADAKQHHGNRYARFRGLTKVPMQFWLATAAQDIKKITLMISYLRKVTFASNLNWIFIQFFIILS